MFYESQAMSDNTNSWENVQWEKKTAQDIAKDRYRFDGERYSFRGTAHNGADDWIPQQISLFAFPKGDMQNPLPQ